MKNKIFSVSMLLVLTVPTISSVAYASQVKTNQSILANTKTIKNILKGHIEYSANSTEFATGDEYEGKIHLTNDEGNVIAAGTKILISIPTAAISYDSLDFSDSTLTSLFNVETRPDTGQIILTLKADIKGVADIIVPFSGTIIGPENTSYLVNVTSQNTNGTFTDVIVDNNQIIIPKEDSTNPTYSILNMFWGVEKSELLKGTYIGKNPIDINGIPTGTFSRSTNSIQNFIEINPEQRDILKGNDHYEVTYEIHGTNGLGEVKLDQIEIIDENTGKAVPETAYVVSKTSNQISFVFQTPDASGTYSDGTKIIQSSHTYIINDTSLATSDGDIYNSNSTLKIKGSDGTVKNDEKFALNNIFTDKGKSVIFPNIEAADKVFNSGELNSDNILGKVNGDVSASDTIDGDITDDITTDYKDLLSKKDSPGVYQNQVDYVVKNSLGYSSSKSITVTITDKQSGKDVTVKYVDTTGKTISNDVIKSGAVGDDYTTEQKDIDGYTFKEVQGNASGKFTDQAQTVTYVYTKNPDKSSIEAHDSTINVGDSWKPEDNFNNAYDNQGNKATFNQIIVDGSPDTNKVGVYKVTYTYNKKSSENFEILNSQIGDVHQGGNKVTVTVTVKNATEVPPVQSKPDNNSSKNKKTVNNGTTDAKSTSNKSLPRTGEEKTRFVEYGLLVLAAVTGFIVLRKKNIKKNDQF